MTPHQTATVDGNEAVASVAHRLNEVVAIYPITPSSPMGEWADEWSANGQANIWGQVPQVVEMQSEGGVAGAVHGALQAGALTTTFTASQGLLLMLPNLYKIAGELTPFCLHVAARTVATHALSIFGDHSDVMACRHAGLAMLVSASPQEAHDFACVAQAASLESRIPFMHFFDGFRTSHQVSKIAWLSDDDLRFMVPETLIAGHRERALTPDRPVLRGTAQNPDVFFQAREAANLFYDRCPEILQQVLARFGERTGRPYRLFDYVGHPEAERVIVVMGSAADVVHEAVESLVSEGQRVGVVKVRLFRPFVGAALLSALPHSARAIAVLDRTKEPGAAGEPLYQDVVTAVSEARSEGRLPLPSDVRTVGGRYGLSSKEFDPAMVRAVFDNLGTPSPRNHFTIGIVDDVTGSSLEWSRDDRPSVDGRFEAIFYGLGSDGTVGANKNAIKIIGEETSDDAQGYFVYDSKKSGAMTISHLRFGPGPIRSAYLVRKARFVACHQFDFLDQYDVLEHAAEGAVFLLNAPYGPADVWDHLPREVQQHIVAKKLRLFAIDAYSVARRAGLGGRINSIMQTCFFAISGVLPRDRALDRIKNAIEKTYGRKGAEVVRRNFAAVDETLENLSEVTVPNAVSATHQMSASVAQGAPEFVRRVSAAMLAGRGDWLPVSAFPVDGTWPTGTARWEKRSLAQEIPLWDPAVCIQCNKCAFVCPHAAIRSKIYSPEALDGAPPAFLESDFRSHDLPGLKYTIQVAPDDCTGCGVCVEICPAKDKAVPRHKAIDMSAKLPALERERANYEHFLNLPEMDRDRVPRDVKGSQFLPPLFEYSGACAGCGETPYVKLLTQLYGDRLLIANATGCSSIYGGNLPTTPYTVGPDGRGPAWSNSLFEDNAEFGLGFRLAVDSQAELARSTLRALSERIADDELVAALLDADQSTEAGVAAQRRRVEALRKRLAAIDTPEAARLRGLADYLVRKSVWIVGGDGWAYDIGFGGLDHVLSTHHDVNVLVLDTEVYSNTGGQQSKATPLGAAAKFAISGKDVGKKDLGMMAMGYGHVYVARVAYGAKDAQTIRAFEEAESYPGPSLIIAYSHCIAHGYDMVQGPAQQKLAVDCGVWPLYRFDPRRIRAGQPPLRLDSGRPKVPVRQYMRNEGRFRMTEKIDPERYRMLAKWAEQAAAERFAVYEQLAAVTIPQHGQLPDAPPPPDPDATGGAR